MGFFIRSAASISPLGSFLNGPHELQAPATELGYFTCNEPEYKDIIDKKYLRRMSRFMKLSVASALKVLKEAGIEQPDALITATGLGCTGDTIDFLTQIHENAEAMLNPTAFMQSTHNTPSGMLAILLGCRNFNITFSQQSLSFESALLHSMMMLAERTDQSILVGGTDEITSESYALIKDTGCIKGTAGSRPFLPGEGSAFFLLGSKNPGDGLARIEALKIFTGLFSESAFSAFMEGFFEENGLRPGEIDLLLTGAHPGDASSLIQEQCVGNDKMLRFKDYCGEFDTSSAFALWLATALINGQIITGGKPLPHKILIHNEGSSPGHSLILVSSC